MGSILFLAANFENLPQQAKVFTLIGVTAMIVALCVSPLGKTLSRLFWFGFNLPERLARKAGLLQNINAVHQHSKIARLEILADLPLQPKTANSLYKQAEAIWKNSTDERIAARAFETMSTLARNKVAILDMN